MAHHDLGACRSPLRCR